MSLRPVWAPARAGRAADALAFASGATVYASLGVTGPSHGDRRINKLAILDIARRHDLWVVSDEAYEDVIFAPHEHHSIGALVEPGETRVVSIFSFSKSHAMAGLRTGYIVTRAPILISAPAATALSASAAAKLSGPAFGNEQAPVKTSPAPAS